VRLPLMILVATLSGCTLAPHTFAPAYRSEGARQCAKACWQPGFGCSGAPFDRCWYNDQCKARCDAVEQDATKAPAKEG
jgi:hypothetical protein